MPDSQHDFDFEFIGFLGFKDPVRDTVPETVRECYLAGIRIIMLTGDYPGFNRSTLLNSAINGVSIFVVILAVFLFSLKRGLGENEARTITFATLVLGNLALITTNASWSKNVIRIFKDKNKALYLVLGLGLFFLGAVLYIPGLRNIFHFSKLGLFDVLICLTLGLVTALWFELLKLINRKRRKA